MSLAPGARLGAYEVLRLVGAGGMGEVYQARDTRLDRLVAIKILPEKLAANDQRRQRFEREARAVAALNHPHICDLHDVGEQDDLGFIVMEFVEGHTLEDRLVRGPLPAADVLRYATELADALDHAHRRGLVHRDLKPGNVMVTESGAKLLDFGLSKLHSTPDLIELSTIASDHAPLTAQGAVLGTYPYMAPEQLEGRETDARSDIFAFGAIVYEMATGRRAFQGATAASLIGAILHTDPPPLSTVQPLTPPGLDRIVSRCLTKDPDDRWQTARDIVLELKWIAEHDAPRTSTPARRKILRRVAAAALVVIALAAMSYAVAYVGRARADGPALRLTFTPPPGLTLADVRSAGPVTISPDGLRVTYVASGTDGVQRLHVQTLDSVTAQALAGTDGAAYPFWQPDGRSIGFFANSKLKRVDAAGGPIHTLCNAVLPRGGTWNDAGVIVFSAGAGEHLYQVSAGGGEPTALTFKSPNRESRWPSFLPDGRHFVFFGRREKPGIYVASLDPAVEAKPLADELYAAAAYASDGYLILAAGGGAMGVTLFAQPIDLSGPELTGEPVPLAERVPFYPNFAFADFSVSKNGRLIHGNLVDDTTSLVWFDPAGKRTATVPGASGYRRAVLSPDEKSIGAHRIDPDSLSQEVWLIDSTRGSASRLTSNPGLDIMGLWSPDSRYIVYGSTRDDKGTNAYVKAVDSADAETPMFTSGYRSLQQITDWSREQVVFARQDPKTQWDLWTTPDAPRPVDASKTPVLYLRTEFDEHDGVLSPDGRWMAYTSNQSGRSEVYIGAFPQQGVRPTPVSTAGGRWPQWRRDGQELFYVSSDRTLMAVAVQTNPGLTVGATRALFKLEGKDSGPRNERPYSPTRDGQRFLVTISPEAPPAPVSVLLNWPALRR